MKQYRVIANGDWLVWADDEADALDQARGQFASWHYVQATGLEEVIEDEDGK